MYLFFSDHSKRVFLENRTCSKHTSKHIMQKADTSAWISIVGRYVSFDPDRHWFESRM